MLPFMLPELLPAEVLAEVPLWEVAVEPLGALSVWALLGSPPAAEPAATLLCCEVLPAMLPALLFWVSLEPGPMLLEVLAVLDTLIFSLTLRTPGTDLANSLACLRASFEFTVPLRTTTPFLASTLMPLRLASAESFCFTSCTNVSSETWALPPALA